MTKELVIVGNVTCIQKSDFICLEGVRFVDYIEAREKLKEAKRESLANSCNIKVGRRELEISLKALEKVSRLKEIAKEIKSYDDILYMYEIDKIDLQLLKNEVFEIIQEL